MMQNNFKVLYFASASSYTGKDQEAFPAPSSLRQLFLELESKYPGINDDVLGSSMVTVNLEYVEKPLNGEDQGVQIGAGDEVGIIPPVSSG
jgi:molybdopterin converting factor small subunit